MPPKQPRYWQATFTVGDFSKVINIKTTTTERELREHLDSLQKPGISPGFPTGKYELKLVDGVLKKPAHIERALAEVASGEIKITKPAVV